MSRNGEIYPKALPMYLQLVMVWLLTELNGVEISADLISKALCNCKATLDQTLKNLHLKYPNSVYNRSNLENDVKKAKKALDTVRANLDKRTKEGADPRCINALSDHVVNAKSVLDKATTALENKNAEYKDYSEWSYALNEVKKYTLDEWIAAFAALKK